MINNRGGIGIALLVLLVSSTLLAVSLLGNERETLQMKRTKIHNAVIASILASFNTVEEGDKEDVISIRPDDLKNYINNLNTIPNAERNTVINLMTTEYFDDGEKHKAIYIEKDKALALFKQYLEKNLNLMETTSNVLQPVDTKNSFIKNITIKEFFVHNAINHWDEDKNHPNNDIKDRKYTTIHLYLEAEVYNTITLFNFKGTTKIPIHIDSDAIMIRK
ncbi:MAG: hypothetical protein ACOCRX_01895 [Candidatus Woesearchaeota archaeon]